jgi:hypothetical protein
MVPQYMLESFVKPHPRRCIPRQHWFGGVVWTHPLPLSQSNDLSSRFLQQSTSTGGSVSSDVVKDKRHSC